METSAVEIREAAIHDVDILVPLFEAYRRFYRYSAEPELARQFLTDRISRQESVIFIALDGSAGIGFTQLYPTFSSGAMAKIFILNDLFVIPEARRRGTGFALLQIATEYARRSGAARLVLSTELTNSSAQRLYERFGWKRDTVFCSYTLTL